MTASNERSAILVPKSTPALTVANYIALGSSLDGRDKVSVAQSLSRP